MTTTPSRARSRRPATSTRSRPKLPRPSNSPKTHNSRRRSNSCARTSRCRKQLKLQTREPEINGSKQFASTHLLFVSRLSEFSVSHKDARRQALVRAGQAETAFEREIEEERIEAINLTQGCALVRVDVAAVEQGLRSDEHVDPGQRIVAAV